MFGWLKDKVVGTSNSRAAAELRAAFEPIANFPGSPNRIAHRLAEFVLTGDDETVLSAVLALKPTHGGVSYMVRQSDKEP
ncbi:MAG TPA: hypothetical protein VFS77_19555, partial [Pyrinomonadaceae bacterium]|nr:hypothetical protein [Pyrinomonadaceae bacterium]